MTLWKCSSVGGLQAEAAVFESIYRSMFRMSSTIRNSSPNSLTYALYSFTDAHKWTEAYRWSGHLEDSGCLLMTCIFIYQ